VQTSMVLLISKMLSNRTTDR